MSARTENVVGYVVHFAEGPAQRRWYDRSLVEAETIIECGVEFVITRVDQPESPGGLGYAWAQLA